MQWVLLRLFLTFIVIGLPIIPTLNKSNEEDLDFNFIDTPDIIKLKINEIKKEKINSQLDKIDIKDIIVKDKSIVSVWYDKNNYIINGISEGKTKIILSVRFNDDDTMVETYKIKIIVER